jgi:tRNA threonylcarbamoyladenosine biosynthesis protein TsaE
MTITTHKDALDVAARTLLDALGGPRVVAFYGGMGAGKTTLIAAICAALGVEDATSSPTFSLINWYSYPLAGGGHGMVCHADLYRLKQEAEVYDIGLEEVLDRSDTYVLIEWPQMAEYMLPPDTVRLHIKWLDEDKREISIG